MLVEAWPEDSKPMAPASPMKISVVFISENFHSRVHVQNYGLFDCHIAEYLYVPCSSICCGSPWEDHYQQIYLVNTLIEGSLANCCKYRKSGNFQR